MCDMSQFSNQVLNISLRPLRNLLGLLTTSNYPTRLQLLFCPSCSLFGVTKLRLFSKSLVILPKAKERLLIFDISAANKFSSTGQKNAGFQNS